MPVPLVVIAPAPAFSVAVLAAPEGTVDSVHLSPQGHTLMADRMWRCIAPVLGYAVDLAE